MKPLIAFLIALMLTAFVPAADAQLPYGGDTRLQVDIEPFDGVLAPGEVATTNVTVEYLYSVTGVAALASTQVDLRILSLPGWAVATVSPSSVYFDVGAQIHPATMHSAGAQRATLTVAVTENVTAVHPGEIRIGAFAHENAPLNPSSADDSVLVKVAGGAACHHEAAAAGVAPARGDSPDSGSGNASESMRTASASPPTPFVTPTAATVLALGLVGAGAGAALAHRRR